jgi:hypothetical protein
MSKTCIETTGWQLGKQRQLETVKIKKQERIDEYNKTPRLCKKCNIAINYKDKINGKKFCNRSCAVSFNNSIKALNSRITRECIFCKQNFETQKHRHSKYCSLKCSAKYRVQTTNLKLIKNIEDGEQILSKNIESNNAMFRKYLILKNSSKCMLCGWAEINPFTKKVPIELEHKDGNCINNKLENLILLCPNCHSLSAHHKGANKSKKGSPRYKVWKDYFSK